MKKVEKTKPKLRFPGFIEPWKTHKLRDFGVTVIDGDRGKNYPNGDDFTPEGFCVFLNAKNVTKTGFNFQEVMFISEEKDKSLSKGKLAPSDVVLTTRGTVGNIALLDSTVAYTNLRINSGMVILRAYNSSVSASFLYSAFFAPPLDTEVKKTAFGSAQPQLTVKGIYALKFGVPDLPEQKKIAEFLTSVDERIQQLTQKKALLEAYKKGVMQQLFSQELRFKDDEGNEFPDWEEKKLGEIGSPVKTKNRDLSVVQVLTNSAVMGVVRQQDYFDKDIANQKNIGGYYVVRTNDFVYNPRISETAPVGPIKRNHLEAGVMSPLYTVFSIKYGDLRYYEFYFETKLWHEYMNSVANFGARHDRMAISVNDFYRLPLPYPSLEEQTKIANFLSAIDRKIENVGNQITETQTFKKGLLQQMFV